MIKKILELFGKLVNTTLELAGHYNHNNEHSRFRYNVLTNHHGVYRQPNSLDRFKAKFRRFGLTVFVGFIWLLIALFVILIFALILWLVINLVMFMFAVVIAIIIIGIIIYLIYRHNHSHSHSHKPNQ